MQSEQRNQQQLAKRKYKLHEPVNVIPPQLCRFQTVQLMDLSTFDMTGMFPELPKRRPKFQIAQSPAKRLKHEKRPERSSSRSADFESAETKSVDPDSRYFADCRFDVRDMFALR